LRGERKDQPQSKDPYKRAVLSKYKGIFTMKLGYPPSPRISGIIDLAENREIIYVAQWFRGKILSRKDLAPVAGFASIPLSPWLVSACWIVSRKDWDHSGV
jgi:hypothetical protein